MGCCAVWVVEPHAVFVLWLVLPLVVLAVWVQSLVVLGMWAGGVPVVPVGLALVVWVLSLAVLAAWVGAVVLVGLVLLVWLTQEGEWGLLLLG